MGNKHYHCWEWLDIDTASLIPTKAITAANWHISGGLGGNTHGKNVLEYGDDDGEVVWSLNGRVRGHRKQGLA